MTSRPLDRRAILGSAVLLPLLVLPGCTTGVGGFSLTEAIRRLLMLSSQRAFATLLRPGGFYDSQVARIAFPVRLARSGSVLNQLLTSQPVRDRLARTLNSVAERGAERAAPIVTQTISSLTIADALAVVRGGPDAATRLLEGQLAGGLVDAMFPEVGDALRIANDDVLARALRLVTGYDISAVARDVADGANHGIWNAIAGEEAAIRADPQATGDPVLIGVFALAG